MELEQDPDPELTLQKKLRWDIDGTEAKDGVDPKLKSKSCNSLLWSLESTPKISWGETVKGFGAGAWVWPDHM